MTLGSLVRIVSAVPIAVIALTACGSSGFDRSSAVESVTETWAVDADVAECMVDRLVDAFGEERLATDRQPTGEEVGVLDEARPECETREQWIELIAETAGDRDIAACIFDTAAAEFGLETVTGGQADPEQADRLGQITEDCARA